VQTRMASGIGRTSPVVCAVAAVGSVVEVDAVFAVAAMPGHATWPCQGGHHLAPEMAPNTIEPESYTASTCRFWVELRGFEPLTPSMRAQCSTGQTGQVTASAQVSGLRAVTLTASDAA
jgi:hypothetical protein